MTPQQLLTLKHFDNTEIRIDGLPVDWSVVDFRTIHAVDQMRARLGSPAYIIRETHPNRPGAIDGTCPGIPLKFVFMEGLLRIPEISFGVYAGNSWHVDFRADDGKAPWPARWMAVKPQHKPLLKERGLLELVSNEADGWVYLKWNHVRSFDGLALVFELSEHAAGKGDRNV